MGYKGVFGVLVLLLSGLFAGCGSGRHYTTVDGVMLGTTLHVVADVRNTTSQELYRAVMDLDREAKASMSIFDEGSLLSRLNRNETDSVDRHIAFNLHLADNDQLLYCLVTAFAGEESAAAELSGSHDNITRVWKNGALTFEKSDAAAQEGEDAPWPLTLAGIYDLATTAPIDEISFILEAARMNRRVAEEGLRRQYGLGVGKMVDAQIRRHVLADDLPTFAVKLTAAAADARMAGVMMPVMSNSGSGNQGITCTMPVVACAIRQGCDDEQLTRALIVSHLTSIHIKHHLGRLSAHCGAMVAATAAACGMAMLMGGGLSDMERTIRNMVGNVAGMICDGAKSSCALKVATAVSAGIQAVLLALDGAVVPGNEGIVDDDIESCIANLGRLGSTGMKEADKVILAIMLHTA